MKVLKNGFFLIISAFLLTGAGVTIQPAAAAEGPHVDFFTTNGPSATSGQPMLFSWQARNADQCTAFGGWGGVKGLTGNEEVATPGETTTYGLQCTRGEQRSAWTFQITVNPTRVFFDFMLPVQHILLAKDATVQLAWQGLPSSGICILDVSGMRINGVKTEGSQTIAPSQIGNFKYTLECRGGGLSAGPVAIRATVYDPHAIRFINASQVRDGDRAGNFAVASIQALRITNAKDPYADKISATNARIDLKGRAIVTGTYHYFDETAGNIFDRNRICMKDITGASEQQLPRFLGVNKNSVRFCFNNGSAAAAMLSASPGTSGIATVVIDGYTLIGDHESRPDEAYLLNVSAKKQIAPISAIVDKPATPAASPLQPVIIYIQPNQQLHIVSEPKAAVVQQKTVKLITPKTKKAPVKKYIVRKKSVTSKPKAQPKKKTPQPPKGQSTIKKVVPGAHSVDSGSSKIAQPSSKTKLFDAYIN